MTTERTAAVTLRIAPSTKKRLQKLAAAQNRTVTDIVVGLIEEATGDHEAYYTRLTAVSSYMTSAMVTYLLQSTFKARTAEIVGFIQEDAEGLFGPLPQPPESLRAAAAANDRLRALFDRYALGQEP